MASTAACWGYERGDASEARRGGRLQHLRALNRLETECTVGILSIVYASVHSDNAGHVQVRWVFQVVPTDWQAPRGVRRR